MTINSILNSATGTTWIETEELYEYGYIRLWETQHDGKRKIVNYNSANCTYTYATGHGDYIGFSTTFGDIEELAKAVA